MPQSAAGHDFVDPLPVSDRGVEKYPRTGNVKAPVFQLPRPDFYEPDNETLAAPAAGALNVARNTLTRTYLIGKARGLDAYDKLGKIATELSSRAKNRARSMKEEQPMQVLGVAAGAAFAIGVALRIWRSSRYEQ